MEAHIGAFRAHLQDKNRSPATIVRYIEAITRLAVFARRELHRAEVGFDQIDRAIAGAFLRQAVRHGERLAPATRNQRLSALRTFYRWAIVDERTDRDPTAALDFARGSERAPTFLTAEEFDRVLQVVEVRSSEHYRVRNIALLVTLFHTGMRLSEVLSLDLAQVDLANERFTQVRRKGGDRDDVFMNDAVVVALRRWLWHRQVFPNANSETAVFLSDQGRRWSKRSLARMVERYSGFGVPTKHVTPHTMRHSTATELIRRGNGIEVVADVLGHENLQVTKRYVHLVGAQVRAAVATLARPADARASAPRR